MKKILAFFRRDKQKDEEVQAPEPFIPWEDIVRKEHERITELARNGFITPEEYEEFYNNIQTKVRFHTGSAYYEPLIPPSERPRARDPETQLRALNQILKGNLLWYARHCKYNNA